MLRFATAVTGMVLGTSTLMPNLMMSASGSPKARCSSAIGLSASGAFFFGGFMGGPMCLLPGLALQIGAFVVPPRLVKMGFLSDKQQSYEKLLAKLHPNGISHGNPGITFWS